MSREAVGSRGVYDSSKRCSGVYKKFEDPFKFVMSYSVDSFGDISVTFSRKRGLFTDECIVDEHGSIKKIKGFSDKEIGYFTTVLDAEIYYMREFIHNSK